MADPSPEPAPELAPEAEGGGAPAAAGGRYASEMRGGAQLALQLVQLDAGWEDALSMPCSVAWLCFLTRSCILSGQEKPLQLSQRHRKFSAGGEQATR